MNNADKGQKGGSCNVTACQAPGALYWNKSTRAYYCEDCAREINWPGGRADTMKLYGTPLLCELDEEGTTMNYNEMAQKIYAQNKAVGWWDDPDRCLFECLQLVSTEVAEATEAERKDLMDDHLPHRKGGEVELADAQIRVLDLGGRLGLKYADYSILPPDFDGFSVGRVHLHINERVCRMARSLRVPEEQPVAAAYSRLLDSIRDAADALGHGDLHGAVLEKLEYNRQRADHKRENRAKPGGKAF